MLYNIPSITSMTSWLQWINTLTSGWFGPGIVIGFFIVFFLSMKNYKTEQAFASSMYLSTLLCFLFFLIGMTEVNHLFLCGIGTIFSTFVLHQGSGY